jgi:hypothetical protein
MKKKYYLPIIIAFITTLSLIYFLVPSSPSPLSEPLSCESQYNEIRSDIENANFCENDGDCDTLILGGSYIDFGCYHFVNNNIDKQYFYDKMSEYATECVDLINDCAPVPNPKCIANKCVYAE